METKTYTAQGVTVRIEYHYDSDSGEPWKESDGHGPVRYVRCSYGRPDKRPGERVMHSDRHGCWLYDWQAACKTARADGWNVPPYDAPNRIERAVRADFDYLSGYLSQDWHYVGLVVTLLDDDGNELVSDSLWGLESLNDYHEGEAQRMADELLAGYAKEQSERAYWASRDVVTS